MCLFQDHEVVHDLDSGLSCCVSAAPKVSVGKASLIVKKIFSFQAFAVL